ncbi:MAG: hypothetical protein HW380_2091 [Magnetococcales bacterium]|nr:hypothetical protein [Magnetococcales bacterium]HIJ84328.1 hypothetical protein [Magnetococcales bacterium]
MSEDNANGAAEIYQDWHLWWGGAWKLSDNGVANSGDEKARSRLPLFPSYYSYLLKLAPGVGLVDIYPWLAELMIFSVAVDGDADSPSQDKSLTPLNMVSIFVDDNSDNVALSRLDSDSRKKGDPIEELLKLVKKKECLPKLFMVDTLGQFKDTPLDQSKMQWTGDYVTSHLVGGGNPMQMMRLFTSIGSQLLNPPLPDKKLGKLNCFVINSISNLYRSMGVRDAMLLVRAMMEQGVWKSGGEVADSKKKKIIDNKGMVFAILHDGVFPEADTRYIETFFDGVILFEKKKDSSQREITFRFERFPPSVPGRDNHVNGYPFQPDFSNCWTFKSEKDGRLKIGLVNLPPRKRIKVAVSPLWTKLSRRRVVDGNAG